jgi:excisionase family DNA binding protein
MSEIDGLLTTRQLQSLLQVDRITIYRMLRDGRLQGFKAGGRWRFSRQVIERWLQVQGASLDLLQFPTKAKDLQPSAEALPLPCIRAIQGIFAEALGVGTVATAVDGTPITPIAHSCEFCNLVLDTRIGRQRCTNSWRAAAAEPGGTTLWATCHAGLHYVWGRIEIQGQFVAATHAGQFLARPPGGEGWSARIEELSTATGISSSELRQALASVPVLEEDRRLQVPRLLHCIAVTLSEIGEERLNLLGRLQRIAQISTL